MFGYIKPMQGELLVKEYELYRAVYCGLCAALGKNISCSSRLSLSYDFVFLALVRMALSKEEGRIEKRRCIAHPTKKRSVLTDAPSLDYAARVSATLTYSKLRDDIADSRGIKKLGAYLLLPAASGMRRRARLPHEFEEHIRLRLSELTELERSGCDSPDRAAEPFGELMAYIVSYGYPEGSAEHRIASEIGRHIGRFIYLADALDDLFSDMKSKSYNPFIMADPGDPASVFSDGGERIRSALIMELSGASAAAELIDPGNVPEYLDIIKNILYLGLPGVTDKIIGKYTAKADNGDNKND